MRFGLFVVSFLFSLSSWAELRIQSFPESFTLKNATTIYGKSAIFWLTPEGQFKLKVTVVYKNNAGRGDEKNVLMDLEGAEFVVQDNQLLIDLADQNFPDYIYVAYHKWWTGQAWRLYPNVYVEIKQKCTVMDCTFYPTLLIY